MSTTWASLALPVSIAGVLLAFPSLAAGQSSGKAESLLREGHQALQSEDYEAAKRYFRAAVAADPRSPNASCGLGQVHMAQRQYPEAILALENCRTQLLGSLRRLQAEQTRSFGGIETAIRELRDTIQDIQSGRIKGGGADRVMQLEARIRELEQMKNRDPVRIEVPPEISFALGTAYLQVGQLDEAERELLTVLRTNPDSGEAHNNLAAVYLAQSRFEEAAERVRLAEAGGARVSPQMKADIAAQHSPGVPSSARAAPARTSRPEEEPVSIQHESRSCAADGVFVRIAASATPSWGIHDPILRFRTEEDAGWYSATMLPTGGDGFAVTLPKPRGAKSFEYFIEVSSYDEKKTRTDDFQVAVVKKRTECAEASADLAEAGGVLIIDVPRDIADAPPVPPGFSIRGTTSDVGMLEIGMNKALIAGGVALAAAAGTGVAAASKPPQEYSGPRPFVDAPGVEFVTSDPPPGSTLSLSGGQIAIQLLVYAPQSMPGASIRAELAMSDNGGPCIVVGTHQDLAAGRKESVVVSGPTLRNENCSIGSPLEVLRVVVIEADGIGGFRTGYPPLRNLRVLYHVTE